MYIHLIMQCAHLQTPKPLTNIHMYMYMYMYMYVYVYQGTGYVA